MLSPDGHDKIHFSRFDHYSTTNRQTEVRQVNHRLTHHVLSADIVNVAMAETFPETTSC